MLLIKYASDDWQVFLEDFMPLWCGTDKFNMSRMLAYASHCRKTLIFGADIANSLQECTRRRTVRLVQQTCKAADWSAVLACGETLRRCDAHHQCTPDVVHDEPLAEGSAVGA